MVRILLILLIFALPLSSAKGQDDEAYLKTHGIQIDNPELLSNNVYTTLSPFQVIMFGEMHGTNESAPFVSGLATLFTKKGDSVIVGLEIPPKLMSTFTTFQTESSIYQSDFFRNPPFLDGRESYPWANLISTLNKNPGVKIFFFDVNEGEDKNYNRDSLMAVKIKIQFNLHPTWKMITLSGNYHNRISNPNSMTTVLKRNISANICTLNMEYKEGTCMANFKGEGFKKKELGSYPSIYNSTEGYDRYLLLLPTNSTYDYDGFYYTKYITAATMTISK